MIFYFAVLFVPLLMSFTTRKRGFGSGFGFILYFIALFLFVGFRDHVGPDWQAYEWNLQLAEALPWGAVYEQREPGFVLLAKLSASLGWGVYGINAMCAFLFLSGAFRFAKETPNPWLSVTMVLPYLVFVVGMSGVRQAAAIGLTFWMLATWRNTGTILKSCLILLAMSIHNSAILMFAFLIVRNDRYLPLRLLAAGLIAFLSASAIAESAAFARYTESYVDRNVQSVGALAQVALSTFPAVLYFLFRKKLRAKAGSNQQVDLGALMAVTAFLLVPLSTTGISRAALYLSFVQMWFYPAFAHANANRIFVTFASGVLAVVIFFVYFLLGTHAVGYLPYESILW